MAGKQTGRIHIAAPRYRVIKAFTGDDGRVLMPGEIVTSEGWPFGREALLIDQRYIVAIGDDDADQSSN